MEEIWKDVIGWKGYYQVSNLGRVRSLDRIVVCDVSKFGRKVKGCIMTLRYDKDGYKTSHFRKKGVTCLKKVHRLVAEAFILNPNNYKEVDHINGIRDDNRAENLRWCTNKQNCNFELAKKNRSKSVKESYNRCKGLRELRSQVFSQIRSRKVALYYHDNFIKEYPSQRQLALDINIDATIVSKLALGKRKEYNGYSVKIV